MKKMNLIYWVVLSVLTLISCSDTTASDTSYNTGDGGLPAVTCPTDYTENPASKAALKVLIDKYIADNSSVDLSRIDISQVTDMSELFKDNTDFNGDISCWDMSGVAKVDSMFEGATNFNQDLSGWVLKAGVIAKDSTAPTKMFYKSGMLPKMLPTKNFYQYAPTDNADLKTITTNEIAKQGATADLSIIDTSQMTDMNGVFKFENSFNGYVATWDTSSITNMESLFESASVFNQPIGNWITSNVTTMDSMFFGATAFNQPIGNWITSKVTDMAFLFKDTEKFNQPIGNWDTSSVTNMAYSFSGTKVFNQPIGKWDTRKVKSFYGTFSQSSAFNKDISSWKNDAKPIKTAMFVSAVLLNEYKADWMK